MWLQKINTLWKYYQLCSVMFRMNITRLKELRVSDLPNLIKKCNRYSNVYCLRLNLEFRNNLTTIGSLHLLEGWKVVRHEVKFCVCLQMTCNISHFLIYCAYLGHKPLGVMFQDKSVCERVCHSNGLTWIECHRKNYVSWSITFTCTLLIACCIHASKWIAKHTKTCTKHNLMLRQKLILKFLTMMMDWL